MVLRWTLLLLIQAASQEREETLQKQALKAILRVIDSVRNEELALLETVEECCSLEHLGIGSVKEAEPFTERGEIGWCFWRQEKENGDIVSVCRCLLPWRRGLPHPLLLCVLRESVVLQRVLEVKWSLEWRSKCGKGESGGTSSAMSPSATTPTMFPSVTTSTISPSVTTSTISPSVTTPTISPSVNPSTTIQPINTPSIAQSDAFLLEFNSLMRLLRHKPSLFPSLSPSYVLEHSLDDLNRQLEEAKNEAKNEDGRDRSS